MSFESTAVERRPLSVTERAGTRRHGEDTAREGSLNQLQRSGRSLVAVLCELAAAEVSENRIIR